MGQLNRPGRFSTRVSVLQRIAPAIVALRLEKPPGFTFIPGQFVRFHVDGTVRDYTLTSASDAQTLDLCIALVDGGRFSETIGNTSVGDRFELSGPHGHFTFRENGSPAVFVATGTGIAPFVAYCRSGVRDALLLHGVRQPADLIYRDLLQGSLRSYIPCISRPCDLPSTLRGAVAGRVTRYLETLLPVGRYDFYLCGRSGMVRDVTAVVDRKFPDSRLFIEAYD